MLQYEVVYIHKEEYSVGIPYCFNISSKGFGKVIEVSCNEIECLTTYCKGLLEGILAAKNLNVRQVVFQPADSRDSQILNKRGQPVTVFKVCDDRKDDYYSIHIFFDTKTNTILKGYSEKYWES